MSTQPFHYPAGRWMGFGDGCPGAPARCRDTSERSGPRWRSPGAPPPGSRIKSGPGGGCSSGAAGGGGAPAGPGPAVAPPRGERTLHSARGALPGLPARTMRELPLVLLVLVVCQAPRGSAAPVPAAGETVLAKMYPRGNHWAVGHLMGKKSTAESAAYVDEGGSPRHRLREYILWEEAARNLLSLVEGKGTRSHQSPQGAPLAILQSTWDSEDSSNWRDVSSRPKGSQREGRKPQRNDNDNGSLSQRSKTNPLRDFVPWATIPLDRPQDFLCAKYFTIPVSFNLD
ncbi:LOW QUALITY PROTEIN: gastrin-releasing peptide [Phyllostomus discolor]|uniref:Gastrin-releasing peptide n=1 Tax=Phyllostomus discolor TaxID=89673 RepID=A0A7E6CID2_9CHIR|nr:LOW QUALITY PROTEIN: gastrin-releasing peptide [Phyllostomus discolor]